MEERAVIWNISDESGARSKKKNMVCDPYVYRTGIAILSVAVGDRAVQSSGRTGNQLFCNYFLVCSNLERKERAEKERAVSYISGDPSEENERLAIGEQEMKNRKSCGRSGYIFEKHTGRLMQEDTGRRI